MSEAAANEHPPVTAYIPPPGLNAAMEQVPLVEVGKKPSRVGYLTNYSFHIWYQIVIEILKRRGAQYGIEIEVLDAELSVEKQIEQAREIIGRVDAVVLTPANTEGLEEILKIAEQAGKPVVVEANPVKGMTTMVAICDYDAGFELGQWVGSNVQNSDGSPLRILDVGLPWLRPCLLRSEGFVAGVRNIQPDAIVTASINGEATPSVAKKIAAETLREKGDVDVIFAMDDETAQGAYQGYLEAGFDGDTVVIAGFGLSGNLEKDWMMQRAALKVSAGMFPEYVGLKCIDDIVSVYDGQDLPVHDITPTVPLTADNLERYYPNQDGHWTPDLKAIAAISRKTECTKV